MKRKYLLPCCLLLALLVLAGCGPAPSPPEDTTPATTQTAEPTEETVTLEAIHTVDGIVYQAPPGYQVLDDETVVVSRFEYTDDDYTDGSLHLEVVDLYEGAVTASLELEDSWYLASQPLSGGRILIGNYQKNCFLVTDRGLNQLQTISVPNTQGFFTDDLSTYYYLSGYVLRALDTASGTSATVEAFADYRFAYLDYYNSQENILMGMVKTSPFSYDTCGTAIDLDTGEFLMLSSAAAMSQFSADGVCCQTFDIATAHSDFLFADFGDDTFSRIPGAVFSGLSTYLTCLDGSDYLMVSAYTEEDIAVSCDIYRFGDMTAVYQLDMQEFPQGLMNGAISPGGSLICMRGGEDGYGFCILDPTRLPFREVGPAEDSQILLTDTALPASFTEQLEGPPLPDALAPVRAEADALEEAYGVTILMSNQCTEANQWCDYPITTTDQLEWMDEPAYIQQALQELETALSLYPEGFFRQFRNDADEYGLLVLLVEDIDSDNNAVGVFFSVADWYCVAADISYGDYLATYCHEIWHATEQRITHLDYTLLDNDQWQACNPEGFEYSYDDTMDYLDHTDWTYLDGGWGEESCFVDSYARVNELEDRARLMEYIMARGEWADEMLNAPALRRKLEIMCGAIRSTFDTTGWTDVYWERHFTQA